MDLTGNREELSDDPYSVFYQRELGIDQEGIRFILWILLEHHHAYKAFPDSPSQEVLGAPSGFSFYHLFSS